ncbi:MAG: immune inhibitor A [Bacteroidales bacterium]|nr:immune inhibitor A [Bacteroidales bacterium]
MKRFTFLLGLIIISVVAFSQQPGYSKVKVYANDQQLVQMAQAGIDVTEGIMKKGVFVISDYSEHEIAKIDALGLNYEVLIDDVSKFYVDQNIGKSTNIDDYKDAGDYEVPENFEFGSMSGHATFNEIVAHLDNMVDLFPNLITAKESIGQSIEGREMWMVKISDNPNVYETEPEVLYTALHHAREPAGVMNLLFYMYYLLENYDSDPFIQTLVNNTEMYFIPVLNPDGYVYNQTTNPNGGGMWRKNRNPNGGGCNGVDINRNYGYMWGYDNNGSSPDPCDETYRGASAFSEPEIDAVRDFCEMHQFKNALNYHTYSNLLLYAWGYTDEPCPDDDIFYAHATLMTQDNHYTYGPGSTTIYPTNGGSDDWMYGEQVTKNKIFAYTPELGGDNDGFWCPINRIVPIAQENMIQNILAAAFAGRYAEVKDVSSNITNQTSGYLTFDITRLGLMDGGTYTVSLEPASIEVISTGDPITFSNLGILQTESDSIAYELDPAIQAGTSFKFLLSVDNGDYVLSDTITKILGEAIVLFEDNCNTLTNWTSTQWGVTTASYHSPTGSITDSPSGNYPNSQTRTIVMNDEIDLADVGYAMLNFWAKWEIEQGWDFVQLLVSLNGSSIWTPLAGKYTVSGNENQEPGEPLYDGFQTDWVKEEIDLSEFIGNTVRFSFVLHSDWSVNEDGYYFDDFTVSIVELASTGIDNPGNIVNDVKISNPIPNPAQGSVQFNFITMNKVQNALFNIYNATGQMVFESVLAEDQRTINVNVSNWEPGIYYYRMEGTNISTEAKKLVVIK